MQNSFSLALKRYLAIGCISLTVVLTLLFFQSVAYDAWTWHARQEDGLRRHLPQMAAVFLPVPAAFLLWVWRMERDTPFSLRFSPFFCALAVEGLVMAFALKDYNDLKQLAFGIGVVAGLFVLVPFSECARRARAQPRLAVVALIAATAAINYYWLLRTIWAFMCEWTTKTVYMFSKLFGQDTVAFIPAQKIDSFIIKSKWFVIQINPGCSGLEGIFLFMFMLSVLLLIDWEMFGKKSLSLLYVFGIIYMFFFNSLRITVFFTVGYFAYKPDSPAWMQTMRGTPIELFHSYVGWVFYLIAFGIFAAWMYSSAARRRKLTVDGGR